MKVIFQISVLLFPFVLFGQTFKTTTLVLTTKDCDRNEGFFFHKGNRDTLICYKLPEDAEMFRITANQFRELPIKLENIPLSEYKITYTNNFKQLVVKSVKLINQDTNFITLCPDVLLDYSQNTLSKLNDKDTLSINFRSSGCFHNTREKIIIVKKAEKFVAELYRNVNLYTKEDERIAIHTKTDSFFQVVTLTAKNIQDFIRFENELNFAERNDFCTTTDIYEVKSQYLNIKKTDGSCEWKGYYYLRSSFFGERE